MKSRKQIEAKLKEIERLLSMRPNKILSDVDNEIYELTKRIQKKYGLTWDKAKNEVNYSLRMLMLSFPESWLKK